MQTNRSHLRCGVVMPHFLPGTVFNAGPTIETLTEEIETLQRASMQIVDAADEEARDLSEEEITAISTNKTKAGRLTAQVEARQAAQPAVVASAGRRAAEPRDMGANQTQRVPAQPRVANARNGFDSFGQFAMQVRNAGIGREIDRRLTDAATTYGNEGTGADGGFAVPGEFASSIWQKVMGEENLMNRCASLTTSANSLTIPKDETTPWQTSGGILAYWEAEAQQVTASKPALSMSSIRLAKLMALVPISDELLEDSVGLESWLQAKAPAKMAAKINTAIISGTGVGQPLGILTAATGGATISVAIESGPQTADTLVFANIQKMWARLYAPCRRSAVWLINQDCEPQLNSMAFDPAATSKTPVYLPAGGLSESPYATLMGRPVVPIEACSTIGDVGDIILVDLNQYWVLTKGGGGVRSDVSQHLYFDQGLQAFRFTFRMNGQPAWGSSISPQNGTLTRSWAVTLDAR